MATEQVDPVLARLAALETEMAELRARDERPSAPDPDLDKPVTRRRLFGMAGAAAAGAVGATALAATPAAAANGDPIVIGAANVGTTPLSTGLASNTTAGTFIVSNTAAGLGLKGESVGGVGVRGDAGAGIGVDGVTTSGYGVQGTASGGNGVIGTANGAGNGVVAVTTVGTALKINAPIGGTPPDTGAHMWLVPHDTVAGPPTSVTASHAVGQFWMDSAGVLFQCVEAGAPGTWVRQSPLVTLASPVRIYYSVTAGDPLLGNTQERSVTVTNGTTIPHNASAVLTNLAVTPSGADGFLAMFKDGTVWPGTSNLNYSAGAFASNNATSAVAFSAGTGKVKIHCGGGAVHFVIDVFGYYT